MKATLKSSLLLFFASFLLGSPPCFAKNFIDKGHEIFFPKESDTSISLYKNFPVVWWNFLILDGKSMENSAFWSEATRVCDLIKQADPSLLDRAECEQDVSQYLSLLTDWVADYPLRHSPPSSKDLKKYLSMALTKASLPMDQGLLNILRLDPLESYKELQTLAQKRLKWNVSSSRGFFINEQDRRLVIPLKLSFPPDQDASTRKLVQRYLTDCEQYGSCKLWSLVGSHSSTLENKDQIMKDVERVSTVGLIIGLIFALGFILLKRVKLLFLFVPVLLGVGLAILAVIAVFGSIHGLTLSFGTGIIGVAIDYGFLAALHPEKKLVWKSNFMGYVTTCVALATLLLSHIPLLQQIMFFSLCGLSLSFFFIFFFFKLFPALGNVEALPINPVASQSKFIFVSLITGGLLFAAFIPLKLDMAAFNFESPRQKEMSIWLFKQFKREPPLFETTGPLSVLEEAHQRQEWAGAHQVELENSAAFVPSLATQESNLAAWNQSFCRAAPLSQTFTPTERKLFAPWLQTLNCDLLKPETLSQGKLPSYVRDFQREGYWLHLWFPENKKQTEEIQKYFPQAKSLLATVNLFPQTILDELLWMGPLSIGVLIILLFFYYRRPLLVFSALLPFITGLGLIAWIYFFFHLELSFISLIALLMICGFSVDYGIFATDCVYSSSEKSLKGVWTSLGLAALTTITGFIPLVFCQHKVLAHLGQALTVGMIGSLIGSFWGIPFLLRNVKSSFLKP